MLTVNLSRSSVVAAMSGDEPVVVIAHRFSTVWRCDWIAALDRGCVVGYVT